MIEDPRPDEIGAELLALIHHALHIGMESVRVHGSPIVPFAMVEREGVRLAESFAAGEEGEEIPIERCMQLMRERAPLLAFEVERLAVVYDGELETDEGRSDAVFAEGYERGMGTSVTAAQRYRLARRGRPRLRDGPVLLERGEHFVR